MNDLHQIIVIEKMLERKKSIVIYNISRMNNIIARKNDLLNKIKSYRDEYSPNDINESKNILPMIAQNRALFTKRIFELIEAEENEIRELNAKINEQLKNLQSIDNQIDMFKFYKDAITRKRFEINNSIESQHIDDLVMSRCNGESK